MTISVTRPRTRSSSRPRTGCAPSCVAATGWCATPVTASPSRSWDARPTRSRGADRFARVVTSRAIETTRGLAVVHLRIGAAHAPSLTRQAGPLLSAAESALYRSKRHAQTEVVMARASDLNGKSDALLTLDVECIAALNARRVSLDRQPVVTAKGHVLAFHEALVRVALADGTIIPPAELVPFLERRGLVPLLDARVLELAFAGLASEPTARLSLNVSPSSLRDSQWVDAFKAHARACPGTAQRLIVEVTETATIRDPAQTLKLLDVVKSEGARVAIDDFGAGHTSLRICGSSRSTSRNSTGPSPRIWRNHR